MRTALKHIVARTYKPLLIRYLSKTRQFEHNGILLEVPPQVFHPGFFISTQLLLGHINTLPLQGKKLLELGAGSGLIAIQACKKKAIVTATDINPVAVDYLHKNRLRNHTNFTIIRSDLFEAIPVQEFDIIAINPPYYKKQPLTLLDHAWFCGENGEYFQRLFEQLPAYVNQNTTILMALCDSCDIDMIKRFAENYGFSFRVIHTKQSMLEKNFIFRIEKAR